MPVRAALAGLLALLASASLVACSAAVPGAPQRAPAPALGHGEGIPLKTPPHASHAPSPAFSLSAANATSLQKLEAAKPPPPPPHVLPRRGTGEYGPNVPNELAVYSQNGITWCARRRSRALHA